MRYMFPSRLSLTSACYSPPRLPLRFRRCRPLPSDSRTCSLRASQGRTACGRSTEPGSRAGRVLSTRSFHPPRSYRARGWAGYAPSTW